MPLTLKGHPRLEREYRTVSAMIQLYCRHHHKHPTLCNECLSLQAFCKRRLERCIYVAEKRAEKPTCAQCPVHCYKPEPREKIRTIMRWAGPRLLLKHPVLTIRHLLDDRRPAPELPNARKTSVHPKRHKPSPDPSNQKVSTN